MMLARFTIVLALLLLSCGTPSEPAGPSAAASAGGEDAAQRPAGGRAEAISADAHATAKTSVTPAAPREQPERPSVPGSFSMAKKLALSVVYAGHPQTFYCGCRFQPDKSLAPSGCGYVPRNDNVRARRIEWEHVVPASAFGRHRTCWTKGDPQCVNTKGKAYKGRRCCSKVDDEFRRMEADLHNLVPAVGELNGDRSDHPYGEVEGEAREYGACDFEDEGGVAEPATNVRGDIARIMEYMLETYPDGFGDHGWSKVMAVPGTWAGPQPAPANWRERNFFLQHLDWQEVDPPDDWERERNRRIRELQGVGIEGVERERKAYGADR